MLRSQFIAASPLHSLRIVLPRVQLLLKNQPFTYENIIEAPSDTMSLLQNSIAIIDIGDTIIVRSWLLSDDNSRICDDYIKDNTNINKINLDNIMSFVTTLAENRNPVANVHYISNPYSPLNRLIYARLSPSHKDVKNNQILSFPILSSLSNEMFDEIINISHPTDQKSYLSYLNDTIPSYTMALIEAMDSNYNLSSIPISETIDRNNINCNNSYNNTSNNKNYSLFSFMTGQNLQEEEKTKVKLKIESEKNVNNI